MRLVFMILTALVVYSCSNDMEAIDRLVDEKEVKMERATDVELIYSDSAKVKVVVLSKTLLRHLDRGNPKDEFPEGIHVNFYNDNKQISSYLDAKYALRMEKDKKIIVRDSVVFYNNRNDKLETSELIWDEQTEEISSEKFVMISRPEQGDTIMGYGIHANQDFTRFEIKRKFSSKMNLSKLSESLEDKPTPSDTLEKPYLRPRT